MPDPLLITVAPTGAETAKEDCPQLPTTLEELVATAKECEAAGAAMIHVHIRDADHRPTLDLGRLTDTVTALREGTDLVVQLSTGGSVHDPLDQRLKVLDAAPDSCSLTMGTTNFGDDVFSNPWPFVCELYQLSQERQVVPEGLSSSVTPRSACRLAIAASGPARPSATRTNTLLASHDGDPNAITSPHATIQTGMTAWRVNMITSTRAALTIDGISRDIRSGMGSLPRLCIPAGPAECAQLNARGGTTGVAL